MASTTRAATWTLVIADKNDATNYAIDWASKEALTTQDVNMLIIVPSAGQSTTTKLLERLSPKLLPGCAPLALTSSQVFHISGGVVSVRIPNLAEDERVICITDDEAIAGTSRALIDIALSLRVAEVQVIVSSSKQVFRTADVNQIPSARIIKKLTIDEAIEITTSTSLGLHLLPVETLRLFRDSQRSAKDQMSIVIRHFSGTPTASAHFDIFTTTIAYSASSSNVPTSRPKCISLAGEASLITAQLAEGGISSSQWQALATGATEALFINGPQHTVTLVLTNADTAATAERLKGIAASYTEHCHIVDVFGEGIASSGVVLAAITKALTHNIASPPRVRFIPAEPCRLRVVLSIPANDTAFDALALATKIHGALFKNIDPRADDVIGPNQSEATFWWTSAASAEDGVFRAKKKNMAWWRQFEKRERLLQLALSEKAPRFVIDGQTVIKRANRLRTRLPSLSKLFYAIKANPNPAILRTLAKLGIGFECVSPGEISHVLSVLGLGSCAPPGLILFTPNFAPKEEYEFGYQAGAMVTIDALFAAERWADMFAGRDVILRLDPGHGRGHHRHVRTAGKASKFGMTYEDAARLAAMIAEGRFKGRVVGLHAHIGSGILTPEAWLDVAEFLRHCATQLFPTTVRHIDVGGGLGVGKREGDRGVDLRRLEAMLAEFKAKCQHAGTPLDIWMEPGRFYVAEAGVLVARVTQLKRKDDVNFVGIDAGFNSLVRPILYGAHHDIFNLSRLDSTGPTMKVDVVGEICESGDVFGRARELPADTDEGDVILIATTGAYGRSMSSDYNLREPAKEVFWEA